MTRPRIGFIGLGIMGHPMAGHLAKAGFDLTVFDSDAAAIDRLHDVHPGGCDRRQPGRSRRRL